MTSLTHLPADTATGLDALLHHTGLFPLDHIAWVKVTGEDRVRWLNGMATNSVQDLKPGSGNYNFFLNAQGRIQGDGYVFAQPDALLLETAAAQLAHLIPFLDHFIIMDDVELKDVSSAWKGIEVAGPEATKLPAKIGLALKDLTMLEMRSVPWESTSVTAIHAYSPLVPRYELWADPAVIDRLTEALIAAGAVPCNAESREQLRILEGTPLYGVDLRDRELPQETNQARALHFNKGCYLGQEIVERIRSRGNVHRTFHAFRLEGTLPSPGALLESQGKPVGELTSTAAISTDGVDSPAVQLALGYIRREALERSEPIQYPGGVAVPAATPFRRDETQATAKTSEIQDI